MPIIAFHRFRGSRYSEPLVAEQSVSDLVLGRDPKSLHLRACLAQSVGEVEPVIPHVVGCPEVCFPLNAVSDRWVLIGGVPARVDWHFERSEPARLQKPEQLPHRCPVVIDVFKDMVGEHHVIGGASELVMST